MDFKNVKKQVLEGKDLSRKGSIDAHIYETVNYINSKEEYVTTSSCAGRAILLVQNSPTPCKKAKKDSNWLFFSHASVDADEFIKCVDPSLGDLLFKFEPFILHIMCINLDAAIKILKVAIGCGFRESGITIGAHGKVVLAIRSNIRMEVPISEDSVMLVSDVYLSFLARKVNEKLNLNVANIHRFLVVLKEVLDGAVINSEAKVES